MGLDESAERDFLVRLRRMETGVDQPTLTHALPSPSEGNSKGSPELGALGLPRVVGRSQEGGSPHLRLGR